VGSLATVVDNVKCGVCRVVWDEHNGDVEVVEVVEEREDEDVVEEVVCGRE
jgi:hypothetical protein